MDLQYINGKEIKILNLKSLHHGYRVQSLKLINIPTKSFGFTPSIRFLDPRPPLISILYMNKMKTNLNKQILIFISELC